MLAWPSLDWVLSYLLSFKVRYRTTQGSVSHFQHEIRTPLSFFTEETTQAPFGLCEEAGLIQRPVHVGSHFVRRHFLVRECHTCSGKTLQRDIEEMP